MTTIDSDYRGYRRRIRVIPSPNMVDIEMEDDAHHFGVTIHHDGATIRRTETRELRYPWATCPAAGAYLREKTAGAVLATAARVDDQRQHCTHMFDLFVLGAAHALDLEPMIYDIRVSDAVEGEQLADLDRNGEPLLRFRLGDVPVEGAIPAGDAEALALWSRTLPDDLQEAARMLRRGVLVARGRGMEFTAGQNAELLMPIMSGACFSFQPHRTAQAIRTANSVRDFSRDPENLLGADHDGGDRRS